MPTSTVTSKGQITIPKTVREVLGLRAGHRVVFRILEDGTVLLQPETIDLGTLRACLKPRRKGITLEAMDRAIRKSAERP